MSGSVELLVSAEVRDIESVSSIGWLLGMLKLVASKELLGLLAELSSIAGLVGDSGSCCPPRVPKFIASVGCLPGVWCVWSGWCGWLAIVTRTGGGLS